MAARLDRPRSADFHTKYRVRSLKSPIPMLLLRRVYADVRMYGPTTGNVIGVKNNKIHGSDINVYSGKSEKTF